MKPEEINTHLKDSWLDVNLVTLVDLTSLNNNDTDGIIEDLCNRASAIEGDVAAVCVYPKFIPVAKQILSRSKIKIATVVNFPEGNHSYNKVASDIEDALILGADEIDLVFPYQDYMQDKQNSACELVAMCRQLCPVLKVIIETGELKSTALIEQVTWDVIQSGPDFIKTSTGKVKSGASLEACAAILRSIHKYHEQKGKLVGLKVSGGIKTVSQANDYILLATEMMGKNYIHSDTFRFGASSLLDDILLHKHNG